MAAQPREIHISQTSQSHLSFLCCLKPWLTSLLPLVVFYLPCVMPSPLGFCLLLHTPQASPPFLSSCCSKTSPFALIVDSAFPFHCFRIISFTFTVSTSFRPGRSLCGSSALLLTSVSRAFLLSHRLQPRFSPALSHFVPPYTPQLLGFVSWLFTQKSIIRQRLNLFLA